MQAMCGFEKIGRRILPVWDKFLLHAIGVERRIPSPCRPPPDPQTPPSTETQPSPAPPPSRRATPDRSGAEEARRQRRSGDERARTGAEIGQGRALLISARCAAE